MATLKEMMLKSQMAGNQGAISPQEAQMVQQGLGSGVGSSLKQAVSPAPTRAPKMSQWADSLSKLKVNNKANPWLAGLTSFGQAFGQQTKAQEAKDVADYTKAQELEKEAARKAALTGQLENIAGGKFGEAAQGLAGADIESAEEYAKKQAEYNQWLLEQQGKTQRASIMSPKEMAELSPYEAKRLEEQAKQDVKARTEYQNLKTGLPVLQQGLGEMKDLAGKATYTELGKAGDWLAKQAGFGTEGGKSRAVLEAKINQEILPNLKATFGGQLSDKEYERLRSTLGDPDMTPTAKMEVMDSYLKRAERQLAQRRGLFGAGTPQATNMGQATQQAAQQLQTPQSQLGRETRRTQADDLWDSM